MAETVEWIDPDGASTTLRALYAVKGRFAPPARRQEDGVPEQPGSRLRTVLHDTREFVIPVLVHGATDIALRVSLRALALAMDPVRGDGRLRVTGPAGDQREITCRVTAGLDLDERLGDTATPTDQIATIVFRAVDPYWYATSDTVVDYTFAGTVATFFPIFPIRLSSSEVFADATVSNTGDVDSWPVWVVTGPGSTINLRNLTTGLTITLSTTALAAGEYLTIDTRPGAKTVTRQDGSSLFSDLSTSTALWSLAQGSNAVRIEMGGANSASTVRLSYRPRYLTV